MKYIKTEEAVYGPLKNNDFILKKGTFFGKPILEKSDNIEELFEELVCDERLLAKYCNVEETIKRLLSEGKTIYGAIWTKGYQGEPILKSVAKRKGKRKGWELL